MDEQKTSCRFILMKCHRSTGQIFKRPHQGFIIVKAQQSSIHGCTLNFRVIRHSRYHGALDACSGGQSWQTMLSIGIFFAWEGYIFPELFYQEYHVDYKTSKIGQIRACLVPLI